MIRVLQFLDSLGRGGAETQVLDLCRQSSRFDLDVTMVAAGGGVLESEFSRTGVEFVRLERKLPVDPRLIANLRRLVRDRGIEVVHGYQAVDGLHLYLATRGLDDVATVQSFQGFIQGKKDRVVARALSGKMDANIMVSKSLHDYLRSEVGITRFDNFHTIYNGPDPARLRSSGRSIRNELGLPSNSQLGAMIANFWAEPTKDQVTVCRALRTIVAALPNFHFLFPGRVASGAEEIVAECKKICRDSGIARNVHFLGARDDVADILAELEVFVLSSKSEGFPLSVCEAMLAGVPVVVSDIEPLREAVRDGELGVTFRVSDPADLGVKLISLLQDEARRLELAEGARRYALENFSIDAHLSRLRELYLKLLKQNQG